MMAPVARGKPVWLWAAAAALIVALWVSVSAFVDRERAAAQEAAFNQAENYAIAFEEYVNNILTAIDDSLLRIRDDLASNPTDFQQSSRSRWPRHALRFSAVDAEGELIYQSVEAESNPPAHEGQDYLGAHRYRYEDAFFVSKPVLDRTSGRWLLQLSRKYFDSKGAFSGVLVFSIDRDLFTDFFKKIDVGAGGSIGLIGNDRWFRARASGRSGGLQAAYSVQLPDRAFFQAEGPTEGRFEVRSFIDGQPVLGAYRKLPDLPLVVTVLLSRAEIDSAWLLLRRRLVSIAVVCSASLLVLALVVTLWDTQRRKGRAAMEELQSRIADREIGVTRQKLSEAQKIATLGIVETDWDRQCWLPCQHALALLGLDDQPVAGLDDLLRHVVSPDKDQVAQVFKGGIQDLDVELEVSVDGKSRYLRAVGSEAGDSAFVTLQDVTVRRAAEMEREDIRKRMEEASRWEALGTLAGGIAHEINTPAQFVGNNISFLKKAIDGLLGLAVTVRSSPSAMEDRAVAAKLAALKLDFLVAEMPVAADHALVGVDRIGQIVRAVRDYSYPSTRDPYPFDLNHVIETVATVTRNTWKHHATLQLDLSPDLPLITAVESEISQVLVNLVVNAAQAVSENKNDGPGRIRISSRLQSNRMFEVAVADSGPGVPSEIRHKIFELFFTTKPPGTGTGQGLAISKAIVRRHGGLIEIGNSPEGVALFRVLVPQVPMETRDA